METAWAMHTAFHATVPSVRLSGFRIPCWRRVTTPRAGTVDGGAQAAEREDAEADDVELVSSNSTESNAPGDGEDWARDGEAA